MIVHELDDLPRIDSLDDLRAERFFLQRRDKIFHHRQRDIGLEQRDPHLAHRRIDIRFGQNTALFQLGEYIAEFIGEIGKHYGSLNLSTIFPPCRCSAITSSISAFVLHEYHTPSG